MFFRLPSFRTFPIGRLAIAVVLLTSVAACSKINICGQESKLVGTWTMTSLSLDTVGADSSVLLTNPLLAPFGFDTTGLPLNPRIQMLEDGTFNFISFFDTTTGIYRMERYERKCLLYVDILDFRWQITSISESKLEINSFHYYAPKDTVVPSEIVLEQ